MQRKPTAQRRAALELADEPLPPCLANFEIKQNKTRSFEQSAFKCPSPSAQAYSASTGVRLSLTILYTPAPKAAATRRILKHSTPLSDNYCRLQMFNLTAFCPRRYPFSKDSVLLVRLRPSFIWYQEFTAKAPKILPGPFLWTKRSYHLSRVISKPSISSCCLRKAELAKAA